jgi:hypothetical protein
LIDHEHIARIQALIKFCKNLVMNFSARTVDHHEACIVAWTGRELSDAIIGQFEIKIFGVNLKRVHGHGHLGIFSNPTHFK